MSISLPNYTKKLLIVLFFFVYVSCDKKVSFKDKKIEVVRFEKLFYNTDSADLNQIKNKYPFFFPDSYPDSVWLNRLQDPIQLEIFNEITTQYDSVIFLETGLFKFFKRHKELIDKFTTPKVITVNTDIDYRNKVILADSLLLIGLDNYLGPNHKFYDGIPEYIKEDFTIPGIFSDVAEKFAFSNIPRIEFYTFLDKIIYYGKVLYYKDFTIDIADRYKIGYSKAKMKWAKENEYFVWTYFIENNILFNPDNNLESRFINDSPFSRFYLEIDNESSEMIGKYIGWQIVKSYMKNNDTSLKNMLNKSPIDIYNNSKYKPQKK